MTQYLEVWELWLIIVAKLFPFMINNDAIRLLDYSLNQFPDLLDNNTFAVNSAVYTFLKEEFRKGDVCSNLFFQWSFSSFYGMGIVPFEAKDAFFSKMESLRGGSDRLDPRTITEELQPAMGKNNFSFVTKMLNLLSDTEYPIYDKYVGVVFQKPFTPEEKRLDHQESVYMDIIDTYRSLENHLVIEAFQSRHGCFGMGYMKVLDSIFWKLGKDMENNHEMFPWE